MREAAEMIARQSDDFAPSLATRVGRGLARIWSALPCHAAARRDLAHLRGLDRHALADIGLRPEDLAGLDREIDALAATRRLKLAAERCGSAWARVDAEEPRPPADRPPAEAASAARALPAT